MPVTAPQLTTTTPAIVAPMSEKGGRGKKGRGNNVPLELRWVVRPAAAGQPIVGTVDDEGQQMVAQWSPGGRGRMFEASAEAPADPAGEQTSRSDGCVVVNALHPWRGPPARPQSDGGVPAAGTAAPQSKSKARTLLPRSKDAAERTGKPRGPNEES